MNEREPEARLSLALDQLRDGRVVESLASLLEVWRAGRWPAVADLVDGVSREVDRALPALGTGDYAVWLDVAAHRRPEDVGRLLAVLHHCGLTRLRRRIELLATYPDDPRIGPRVFEVLRGQRIGQAAPLWSSAIAICAQASDPRSLPLIDELLATALAATERVTLDIESVGRRLRKVRKAIAEAPSLPPVDEAILIACREAVRALEERGPREAAIAPPRRPSVDLGQSLLQAILERPDDDAPRHVYADWLLERGDPRGELLVLQLQKELRPSEKKRERDLLRAHALAWTRPLDVALRRDRIRFARGFLDACKERFPTPTQRLALLGHAMWSTVRELESKDVALLTHPCLRSMRRATTPGRALSKLAQRTEPVLLETVIGARRRLPDGRIGTAGMDVRDARAWAAALEVGALVNLRAVSVEVNPPQHGQPSGTEPLLFLLRSPLGRRLHQIEVTAFGAHRLVEWAAIFAELPDLERAAIHLANGLQVFVIERVGPEVRMRYQARGGRASRSPTIHPWVDASLVGFPCPAIRRIAIEDVGKDAGATDWTDVRKSLGRQFETVEPAVEGRPIEL